MVRFINIKKIRVHVLSISLSIFCLQALGQEFTLKQCVEYANKYNGNIINANYDIDIAQKKVEEQRGSILPHVNASGSYINNLKLNTTVLPGDIIGQPGTNVAIKMGTQHNATGGIQLSQKIYDPTYSHLHTMSKLNEEQTQQSLKLTTEEIQYTVSALYYQTLVVEEQMKSLEASISSLKVTLESTELRLKNGLATQIDVDKLQVSYNNNQSQLRQAELNYKQSLNNLKYFMGMPVDSTIVLVDTSFNIDIPIAEGVSDDFSYENRSDYQLQKIALNTFEANKKLNQATYLPSLSFNAFYGTSALRDEFDFFKGGDWYSSSYIGVSLNIPVFDGLQRKSRVSQSQLNIEKSKVNINQFKESIKVELSNSEIEYRNAIDNIQNEKENLDLAEKVFQDTQLEYNQGACTSIELVQSETSFRESQFRYFRQLLNFYIARIALEKSKGTLTEYINNLK